MIYALQINWKHWRKIDGGCMKKHTQKTPSIRKEDSRTEYKCCTSGLSKDIWETISAFSNGKGGSIYLGYEKDGDTHTPVGVQNPDKLIDDFTSTIGEKFNFCPMVNVSHLEENGKPVVVVEVSEALHYQKPIYIKDAGPLKGGFKRVGATDIRLNDNDISRYYRERMGAPDAQPLPRTSLKDIDPKAMSAFRNLRKLEYESAPELKFKEKGLLMAYNLLAPDEQTLTAAGLLLFGRDPMVKRFFPASRLDVIRIKGIEWGKDIDPFLSRDLKGNLLSLRSMAMDFLERFFLIPFRADRRGDRIDQNIQTAVMREALTNLLMHQNYFHPSPSQIRIYDDRIEFYNPGHSLKDPARYTMPGSELRNPSIASVFYDLGWVEAKGTGLYTSEKQLKQQGYQGLEYDNDTKNDTFTLILKHIGGELSKGEKETESKPAMNKDQRSLILEYCTTPRTLNEIMHHMGLKHRAHFFSHIIKPFVEEGFLMLTIPGKPQSRLQKYVIVRKTAHDPSVDERN